MNKFKTKERGQKILSAWRKNERGTESIKKKHHQKRKNEEQRLLLKLIVEKTQAEEKASKIEDELKLMKMSAAQIETSPAKVVNSNKASATSLDKSKRITLDPELTLVPKSDKRNFFAGLKYGLSEQDFVTVTQSTVSGALHFDSKTFGDLAGYYQSKFSGVHWLKKQPHTASIFPKELAKNLTVEFKGLCCSHFGQSKSFVWGHDSQAKSRRFFSIPDSCFSYYEATQLADYGHENEQLKENLHILKSEHCAPCFESLEHHAFNLCTSFGRPLDKKCFMVQWGFQHDIFPFHDDDAGCLGPNLQNGDGFGNEIFTYQIRGPRAWVYVAGPSDIAVRGKKFVGIKFEIACGEAWGLTGNARYNCVHGVVPTRVNSKVAHDRTCFSCRATFTVRNGCVSKADLEQKKLY